jgi:arsenate reductase-like glutaredoxin family protein
MGICPTKKKDDPNLIDDSSTEEPYDLSYEVKKSVVVMYIDPKSKDCQKVQELFSSINSKPMIKDISQDSEPKKLLSSLKKYTGDPAPPFVFITGKYFGRLNEIEAGIKNHTVQKIINEWLNTRVKFGQN